MEVGVIGVERGRATQPVPSRSAERSGTTRSSRPARRRPTRSTRPRPVGNPASVRSTVATTSFASARERLISLTGLFVVLIAVFWALAGGGPVVVGALVIVGLIFTVADAVQWRAVQHDLAVADGEPVPAVPWGFLVGPAGALGVLAALLAGVPVVAALAAIAVVAALPGAITRLPATPRSYRVTAQARRIRRFVRAHGVAEGEPVPGYLVPLGEPGARLFVLAPDGTWGDLMLRPDEPDDVARLARVELVEPTDPNAGGRLQIGPPLWHLMIRSW